MATMKLMSHDYSAVMGIVTIPDDWPWENGRAKFACIARDPSTAGSAEETLTCTTGVIEITASYGKADHCVLHNATIEQLESAPSFLFSPSVAYVKKLIDAR